MRQVGLEAHGRWLLCIELIESLCNLFDALEPLLLFEERLALQVVFLDVAELQKQAGVVELVGVTAISDNQVVFAWQPYCIVNIGWDAFVSLRVQFILFRVEERGILPRNSATSDHGSDVQVRPKALAGRALLAKHVSFVQLLLVLNLHLVCL